MKRGVRLLVLAVTAVLALGTIPAAAGDRPADTYLDLGDSYAFGYNPNVTGAGQFDPANFPNYGDLVAADLGLRETNASCPGETSGSMISTALPDNGCQFWRAHFPLHTSYTGSQLRYAISYLRTHRHTDLVTLQIGGNDVLRLQNQCNGDTSCIIAGLPAVETQMKIDLNIIYASIRFLGHYHGTIVAVPYFAFNYNDPAGVAIVTSLDNAVASVAGRYGAKVADVYDAFKIASANSLPLPGVPCFAGLQYPDPTGKAPCDIHPSFPAGHTLIARSILAVLPADRDDD